jgi:two-component system sensor histidine kinase/response regulator
LQDNLTPDSFELIRQSQALHAETPRQPGKVSRLEVQQYHKNGSLVWMEILTQSMLDEQGRQIGYLGVSRNIDERKEYEKQLQQAKEAAEAANRAKSAFIANMSHELRTPLNAILGFSEFISRAENLTASQRDNLVLINQSGEHLLQIINDILEISKIEAGRTTLQEDRFDLPSLIQNIESLLELRASQQNITLAFHLSPNTPRYVYTDQNKLRQILMNLLSNAIKFSPNGQVSLTTRVDPANHKRLFFTIEDTGVGIAPDEIEMLFTAFAQTSSGKKIQQGTGLGLAISRAFVQLMGGEITVRSRVGQGSCFEFNILVSPLSKEETTPLLAAQQTRALGLEPGQQAVDGGPYRILIVEDVAANRLLMESVLRLLGQPVGGEASAANGLEVRSVSNGQEAVEMWEAWRPHLIWMDIWMPVMDGAEATRQIKARPEGRSTVIIALTAAAFEEDRLQALSAGFDGFVRKPFREKTIVSTLVEHLSLRFVYEAPARQTASKTSPLSLPSPEEVLPSLPAAWLTEMQQALTQGEVKWLRQLADQIQPQAPALAEKLARLIENFELDEISALLQTLSTR